MMFNRPINLYRLAIEVALGLTLIVVALGAWVRLTDAGLGCPDWPYCYGQLWAPSSLAEVDWHYITGRAFEASQAWREMVHRLVSGILGLVIFGVVGVAIAKKRAPLYLPIALLFGLVVQIIMGMLTVTWQLMPLAVTAHFLFAVAIAVMLYGLHTCDRIQRPTVCGLLNLCSLQERTSVKKRYRTLLVLGYAALWLQLFLGVWMSSHYASLACPDFPTCHSSYWPSLDFAEAFTFWYGVGPSYEFGVLDSQARVTIHWLHRINAVLILCLLLPVLFLLSRQRDRRISFAALFVIVVLLTQVGLGILNVVLGLALANAISHTVVAVILLLTLNELGVRCGLVLISLRAKFTQGAKLSKA